MNHIVSPTIAGTTTSVTSANCQFSENRIIAIPTIITVSRIEF